MKTNQIHLNSYRITWAIITPVSGKYVTMHDRMAISGRALFPHMTWHEQWFFSRQDAVNFIKGFNKKLDKKYRVRLIADRQFGMAKSSGSEMPVFPFTNKQQAEVYYIG